MYFLARLPVYKLHYFDVTRYRLVNILERICPGVTTAKRAYSTTPTEKYQSPRETTMGRRLSSKVNWKWPFQNLHQAVATYEELFTTTMRPTPEDQYCQSLNLLNFHRDLTLSQLDRCEQWRYCVRKEVHVAFLRSLWPRLLSFNATVIRVENRSSHATNK